MHSLFSSKSAIRLQHSSFHRISSFFFLKFHSDDSIQLDEATVRETLVSFNNDWKKAFDFFNWVESHHHFRHSTTTYNNILDILAKYFEFDLCWDLIHRMRWNPHSQPDHTTFRLMFHRYASAHAVNDAISTFHRLSQFNLKDHTSFSNLIDALCDHKHVLEAQDIVLGNNKDLLIDAGFIDSVGKTKISNMVLRGWYKMGWWSKCREFWEEMDAKGVHKDLHSYSIYMDILCKSGKSWKAVKLYKNLKSQRIQLDVVVYNIVIRAIGLSQGVDFSIRVFNEMKELGIKPTVVTYNTIMRLLCDSYRHKEALALLNVMRRDDCYPNTVSYHCFFATLEKPKEMIGLFDRMVGSGVRPNMDTYVMLMRKFARWGFLRLVFMVWDKMEQLGCSPDASAYNALIDALVEKGLIDMARKYDEEMLAKGLSPKPRKELGTNLRSNPSIITAVMDTTSNWRDEVQPAFRQRFFNNILHNLQLGHPPESFDEILEFHKIAHSIEQKSYAGATSQAEYVMQIACKMVLMEKAREREWRDYFCPDSRQRIVYKIMKLLKRHLDVTDPEGSQELWRIAERFEEKIFSKADTEIMNKVWDAAASSIQKHVDFQQK
ncbi:hypothetical protein AHAS_Ahas09G0011900 [Arachis hypogaea]